MCVLSRQRWPSLSRTPQVSLILSTASDFKKELCPKQCMFEKLIISTEAPQSSFISSPICCTYIENITHSKCFMIFLGLNWSANCTGADCSKQARCRCIQFVNIPRQQTLFLQESLSSVSLNALTAKNKSANVFFCL